MGDPIKRFARDEEDIRRLKLRQPPAGGVGSDTKTFIVGGTITTSLYIPRFYVSVNPDGGTPEAKYLWGFWARLRLGSGTMSWLHNELFVVDHNVGDTTSLVALPAPVALANGDTVGITFWDASTGPNATDLAAAAIIVPGP